MHTAYLPGVLHDAIVPSLGLCKLLYAMQIILLVLIAG